MGRGKRIYIEGDGEGQEPPTVREWRKDHPGQDCFRPPPIPTQNGNGNAQFWTALWVMATGKREANPAP